MVASIHNGVIHIGQLAGKRIHITRCELMWIGAVHPDVG